MADTAPTQVEQALAYDRLFEAVVGRHGSAAENYTVQQTLAQDSEFQGWSTPGVAL